MGWLDRFKRSPNPAEIGNKNREDLVLDALKKQFPEYAKCIMRVRFVPDVTAGEGEYTIVTSRAFSRQHFNHIGLREEEDYTKHSNAKEEPGTVRFVIKEKALNKALGNASDAGIDPEDRKITRALQKTLEGAMDKNGNVTGIAYAEFKPAAMHGKDAYMVVAPDNFSRKHLEKLGLSVTEDPQNREADCLKAHSTHATHRFLIKAGRLEAVLQAKFPDLSFPKRGLG